MISFGLSSADYEQIWHAPEGHEYSVQRRQVSEREWSIGEVAMSLEEARRVFANTLDAIGEGSELRIVTLSRYPPCSVVKVVKYYRGGE